jgi:DNA repair protein RadC
MAQSLNDRRRLLGLSGLEGPDLLAAALARREADADLLLESARRLLGQLPSLADVGRLSGEELRRAAGLDEWEAVRFRAAVELGKRAGLLSRAYDRSGHSPEAALEMLADLRDSLQEQVVVLLFDAKLQLIRRVDVHRGTADHSIVQARDVFRPAVAEGALAVILAHNHPSGDPTPSREDDAVTQELRKAGALLGIDLIDHLIIGRDRHFSYAQERR